METQTTPQASSPTPPPTPPSRGDFMGTLEYYFVTKAPFQIPADVKEIIINFGPWLIVLFLLTFLPIIFALIGFSTVVSVYSPSYYAGGWTIQAILSILTFILGVMALPGLFRRKLSGWNLIFYSTIISFVGSVLSTNVIGGAISLILSLYILFQIRSYYN